MDAAKPKSLAPGAAPAPKPRATPDSLDAARIDVIRSSLLVAQHWLDAGAESLSKSRGKHAKEDQATVHRTVVMAEQCLAQAHHVVWEAHGKLDVSTLAAQMDETSRAIGEFVDASIAWGPAGDATPADDAKSIDWILKRETALRGLLALSPQAKRGSHVKASKHHAIYEHQDVTAVLDLVRLEAAKAYAQLGEHGDRAAIVDHAGTLAELLEHAVFLLHTAHGTHDASTFGAKIQSASIEVQHVAVWIAGKQNNADLAAIVGSVVFQMDRLRAAVSLGPIGKMKVEETGDERAEAEAEKLGVDNAQAHLNRKIASAFVGFATGITRFNVLAALQRPPAPSSDWLKIARDVLISVLGNLVAPGLGVLMTKVASNVGAVTTNYITRTASDSVKKTAGTIADAAAATATNGSKNQEVRDRELFSEGLTMMQTRLDEVLTISVADRIMTKNISRDEIMSMANSFADPEAIAEQVYMRAAHGFALQRAQQVLKTTKANGKQISAIASAEQYFGTPKSNSDTLINEISGDLGMSRAPVPRSGGKVGSAGIAKLTVYLDEHGRHTMEKLEIHGMNDDMRNAVLAHADFHLNQLGLPLEVEFDTPWNVTTRSGGVVSPVAIERHEPPSMIVDETGTLRASIAWEMLARQSQFSESFAKSYETPQKAWATIRNSELPRSLATITKGG